MTDTETKRRHIRFQAIEYLVYWEGGVNSNILSKHLDVSLLTARKQIQEYQNEYPDNLEYQQRSFEKLYIASEKFERHRISDEWRDYLSFIHSTAQMNASIDKSLIDESAIKPIQQVDPKIFNGVYKAIRNKQAITVSYRSKTRPEGKVRVIHPHAIASNGNRWHCRAFCGQSKSFKDFNINRIQRILLTEPSSIKPAEDINWHELISVTIKPNPSLPDKLQEFVLLDYGHDKPFRVSVKRALLPYYLQFHRISTDPHHDDPNEKPLAVCLNDEVISLLFSFSHDDNL